MSDSTVKALLEVYDSLSELGSLAESHSPDYCQGRFDAIVAAMVVVRRKMDDLVESEKDKPNS